MNSIKLSRISWIETLVLKNSSKEHFSQFTSFITIAICSFLLILSAKIKVDLYPVPMTLQPLAVLMIAMLCGRNISVVHDKWGTKKLKYELLNDNDRYKLRRYKN